MYKLVIVDDEKRARDVIARCIQKLNSGFEVIGCFSNGAEAYSFLRENKMTTPWGATNSWKINFKGKNVAGVSTTGTAPYRGLGDNSWGLGFAYHGFGDFEGIIDNEQYAITENQKNLIWDTLRECQKCPYLCNPGAPMTIFGKKFDSVCHAWFSLTNPSGEALDLAKKIVLFNKNAIINKL